MSGLRFLVVTVALVVTLGLRAQNSAIEEIDPTAVQNVEVLRSSEVALPSVSVAGHDAANRSQHLAEAMNNYASEPPVVVVLSDAAKVSRNTAVTTAASQSMRPTQPRRRARDAAPDPVRPSRSITFDVPKARIVNPTPHFRFIPMQEKAGEIQ